MKVRQAYRFALDPTLVQEHALRLHAGAARFAWNWALAQCKARYAAERKWYSAAELHKVWTAAKKADPALSWWSDNSKCCYQEAFRDLDRALRDFIIHQVQEGRAEGAQTRVPEIQEERPLPGFLPDHWRSRVVRRRLSHHLADRHPCGRRSPPVSSPAACR